MPTPDESALSRKLEVLLHESEQVHDTIGRTLGTANSLYGLVLPVAFTVLAFTAGSEDLHFPPALLSSAFAGVVAATLIYNAGLWVEISRYVRYKYRVIYPELERPLLLPGDRTSAYSWRGSIGRTALVQRSRSTSSHRS